MAVAIRELTSADFSRWDEFVHNSSAATFFHLSSWKTVLEKAFGHRTYFLLAEDNGNIEGILPLAQVKSVLFGNHLSSLPFCVYGGIVASSSNVSEALRRSACELADSLNVGSLEFRNVATSDSSWPIKDLYYTFRKKIDPDNDINLKAIPNRQRAMVRKGAKAGLISEEDVGTKRIYRLYSESVRNLGTPVFSHRYMKVLRDEFADNCRVLMIKDGDQDVAGVMSFYFKGEVIPYYGGSIARARTIKGCNDFMYWELLRRSADEGLGGFDFGRSKKGTGPYSFKKNWGFEPQALPYEYYLVGADTIPNVNPTNPKYRIMVETWRRLPLVVANVMGPFLARSLG